MVLRLLKKEEKDGGYRHLLEGALMQWKAQIQCDYLKRIIHYISGTKEILVSSILGCIPIEDAMEVTREYRIFLQKSSTCQTRR